MNWSTIQNDWNQYKVAAKQEWDKLSEEQIAGTQGKREYLTSRVQEAYALSNEEAELQVTDWQGKQMERQAPAAKS